MGIEQALKDFGIGRVGPYAGDAAGGLATELQNWSAIINKHRGIAMDKEILGMMSDTTSGKYFTNDDLVSLKEKYPHASTEELFKKLTNMANLKQRARMDTLTKAFDKYVLSLPKGPESLTNTDVTKFFQLNDVDQEWEGPRFLEFLNAAVARGAHPRLSEMKYFKVGPGEAVYGMRGGEAVSGEPIVQGAPKPEGVKVFNRTTGTKREVSRSVADSMIKTGQWIEGEPMAKEATAEEKKAESTQKTLTQFESDIMQVAMKIAGIESGQDITSEALGSKKETVVSDLKTKLRGMLQKYQDMGGDPMRFGVAPESTKQDVKDDDLAIQAMTEEYPPEKYKGQVIRDKKTGKEYRSTGLQWIEIRKIEQ